MLFKKGEETKIKVSGMMCAHCVKHVEDALKALDGVKKAKAELSDSSVTVVFDKEKVSRDELLKAIKEAGYGAE